MKLYLFNNYHIDKLFVYILTMCKLTNKSLVHLLLKVLYSLLFFKRYVLNSSSNKQPIWFVITESKPRGDMLDMVRSVQRTISKNKYCEYQDSGRRGFSLLRSLSLFFIIPIWFAQLIIKFSFRNTISILYYLICFNDLKHFFEKELTIYKPNHVVVRYDSSPMMNFVSQFMQLNGVCTSTLQHGVMIAERKELSNNIDYCGIEFKGFVSDYFLAWNDFTKNECIKQGIPEAKIHVLGISKCLFKPIIKKSTDKVVGVILDGKFNEENNIPLIELASMFSQKHGYRYIVRYHPNYIGNEYESSIDNNGVSCSKNISLSDFLSKVNFCLLSNSTVLFELEYYNFPFIRYSSGLVADKFKDYPIPYVRNVMDMELQFEALSSSSQLNNYNTTIDNYNHFFNNFLYEN